MLKLDSPRQELLRVGIIVDSSTIANWQAAALETSRDLIEIKAVLNCTNSWRRRRLFKHFLYYLLSATSIRGGQTRRIPWRELVNDDCEVLDFECHHENGWQILDPMVRGSIERQDLDVVIRFGMNLIRDADSLPVRHGVLSFHHGDPENYRGRPAGFYELLVDDGHIGVIIQELTNKLDGGRVRAIGKYRIERHSYRKTMNHVLTNGSSLLRKALLACREGKTCSVPTNGVVRQLPKNYVVLRFVLKLTGRKFHRLIAALFTRRRWGISFVDSRFLDIGRTVNLISSFRDVPTPREFGFVADPFVLPTGQIVCEAVPHHHATGVLVALTDNQSTKINLDRFSNGQHLSFPFVVANGAQTFLLPEMAQCGSQMLFEIDECLSIHNAITLRGLEDERLIDPILFPHGGKWWLFASKTGNDFDHLFLWFSDQISGPYQPHPKSPVVVDPSCARSAGAIRAVDGRLLRTGQDNRGQYGNGVVISQINELTIDDYDESVVTSVRFDQRLGPHTLDWSQETLVVDSYTLQFDLLAWLPRLRSLQRLKPS